MVGDEWKWRNWVMVGNENNVYLKKIESFCFKKTKLLKKIVYLKLGNLERWSWIEGKGY